MRDPEEKARFRGNDQLYRDNWEHIFNRKESDEKYKPRNDVNLPTEGNDLRNTDKDDDSVCPEHA